MFVKCSIFIIYVVPILHLEKKFDNLLRQYRDYQDVFKGKNANKVFMIVQLIFKKELNHHLD